MEETNGLIRNLIARIEYMDSDIKKDFAIVNKGLDGIDYELKKLNSI